jgi:hypothetical protein
MSVKDRMQVSEYKQRYFEFGKGNISLVGRCFRKATSHMPSGSWKAAFVFALLGLPALGLAQTESDDAPDESQSEISLDQLALELSNPVTGLRSVDWDIEYSTFRGDLPGSEDQTGIKNIFTVSWPFKLNNGKNILFNTTIPLNSDQPIWVVSQHFAEFWIRQRDNIKADRGHFESGHDHLDDITIDIAYGGVGENGFISMFGLSSVVPTSEDQSAGRNQLLLGPEIALGQVTSWGLFGVRAKHHVNVTEDLKGPTSETTLKLFFAYALGNGWQIESNPVILYDWEAVAGNEWTVPIGAAVSKTIRIGRWPTKLAFDIQKYVVTPDRFGPDWQFTLSFTPVLSTKLLQ